MMVEWIFTFIIISYCSFIVYLWLGWERISINSNEEAKPSVAILIPVRNEAENIQRLIKNLETQTYYGHLEVLIIDDHSNDDSVRLIKKQIENAPNYKLISLVDAEGKKAAITEGVNNTKAEIILTTDGDCRVPATWVETMIGSFLKQTQFVSGPVKFTSEAGFFNRLQSIEFASLIGSGAALIGWGKPVMANGANMGFRRKVFLEVGGFNGNLKTASGDDVFLLHKIAKEYPNSVAFAKQEGAIIQTQPQPTITSFVQQRIRWASKWKSYTDLFTKTTAVLVFGVSFCLIAFPFFVGFSKSSLFLWVNLIVIKSFFDFFFIGQIIRFLGERINLFAFVLLQLFYPFYVVFTALFSLKKSYHWKGRKVK